MILFWYLFRISSAFLRNRSCSLVFCSIQCMLQCFQLPLVVFVQNRNLLDEMPPVFFRVHEFLMPEAANALQMVKTPRERIPTYFLVFHVRHHFLSRIKCAQKSSFLVVFFCIAQSSLKSIKCEIPCCLSDVL